MSSRFIFIILFFVLPNSVAAQADSSLDDIQQFSPEELENLLKKEFHLARQKKGSEKTKAIFDLLRYEPHLPASSEIKRDILWDLQSNLSEYGAHLLAAEYGKLALKTLRESNKEYHNASLFGQIGWQYHLAGFLDSAKYYLTTAAYGEAHHPVKKSHATHFNNLGMFYQAIENDSAWYFYKKAESSLESPNDILVTNIRDNLANLHYYNKQYREAEAIHQLNEAFLANHLEKNPKDSSRIWNRYFKAKAGIAQSLLGLGEVEKAKKYVNAAKKYYYLTLESKNFLQFEKQYFNLQILYAEKSNNPKMVAAFQDSLIQYQNELLDEKDLATRLAMNALFDLKMTKFDKELELQTARIQRRDEQLKNARLQNFLFAAILLAALLSAILFFQRRIAHQKKQLHLNNQKVQTVKNQLEQKDAERKKLQRSLHRTERDLLDFSTYLNANQDWTNQVVKELDRLVKSKIELPQDIHQLIKDLKNRQQLDEKIKLLVENIDKINHTFYDNLAEKFPNLTDSEKELCGLFRLNLSNRDIALFRNISPESLKMSKYRLRKKLQLPSEIKLSSYLNSTDIQ